MAPKKSDPVTLSQAAANPTLDHSEIPGRKAKIWHY